MSASLRDRILCQLSGRPVEAWEIYHQKLDVLKIEARDGAVHSLEQAAEEGVALRLFRDGRCGFSFASDLSDASLERMAAFAYNALAVVSPAAAVYRLPGALAPAAAVTACDGGLADRPVAEKAALAVRLEAEARRRDRRIVRVRGASYEEERVQVRIENEAGLKVADRKTIGQLSLMAVAEEAGESQSAWESDFSSHFARLEPATVAQAAADKAVAQLGAKPGPSFRGPALLDRHVVVALLGVLAPSFLGDNVRKRRSALAGKLGQTVYAEGVTLIDDGTLPGGWGSFSFDGEGVARRRTPLVAGGVVKAFLYDLPAAARDRVESTGNAARGSAKAPPQSAVSNFFLQPGRETPAALEAALSRGYVIRDVIGMHTANATTGDFSVGATGFWVEGGRRAPVRGIAIAGNLHALFREVEAVGDDLKFYGGIGAPTVRVRALDVSGN